MDSEKDLLRKDLENKKTPEEINKFVEDAELLGHEDIAELGRKKLQEVSEKADQVEKTSESQISQVNELGGSNEEIENRTSEVDKKIEGVKTQTQEKIAEVQNENKVFGLTTERLKLDAQLDYLFLKKDIPGFTKLLVQKFEKEIEHIKLNNEQLRERELIEKQKDPSFDRSYNIRENETKIKDYEKRIETAKEDVTRLYEYNSRGSSANENISGLSLSQLAGKYNTEIRHLVEENEKYSPSGVHDSFPHKFDKLSGLIDIARQEGDTDLLNYIKQYGVKLPDEIKNKLI